MTIDTCRWSGRRRASLGLAVVFILLLATARARVNAAAFLVGWTRDGRTPRRQDARRPRSRHARGDVSGPRTVGRTSFHPSDLRASASQPGEHVLDRLGARGEWAIGRPCPTRIAGRSSGAEVVLLERWTSAERHALALGLLPRHSERVGRRRRRRDPQRGLRHPGRAVDLRRAASAVEPWRCTAGHLGADGLVPLTVAVGWAEARADRAGTETRQIRYGGRSAAVTGRARSRN